MTAKKEIALDTSDWYLLTVGAVHQGEKSALYLTFRRRGRAEMKSLAFLEE